ncbi:MAG TPA: hydrogenase maturation protease [Cyanobacteria bacterium UBA12227]|nr:hydrogenase maturation protease [Cyanobacteria bacterium UBA12227]HAX90115.1 hydrogenase maturation protease [Cyanobacteria bacterium UBA11370]HBY78791.1 hydrogenase maturation protease [Cyanobacteria bacterium UBA11148]
MNVTDATLSKNSVIVIGYGNTLRSDDGVGQRVASEVQGWELPSVRSLPVHQLTPELAETLQGAKGVIFVDAYPISEEKNIVQITPIEPIDANNFSLGHSSDPRVLLGLTQAIYSYSPPAWLITIPALNFEFGENLSPITQQGLAIALNEIRDLLLVIDC